LFETVVFGDMIFLIV